MIITVALISEGFICENERLAKCQHLRSVFHHSRSPTRCVCRLSTTGIMGIDYWQRAGGGRGGGEYYI